MERKTVKTEKPLFAQRFMQLLLLSLAMLIAFLAQRYLRSGRMLDGYILYMTMVFPLAAYLIFKRSTGFDSPLMNRKLEIFLFVVILITGIFLRLHRINELPPGLWFDETDNAVEADKILKGGYHPVYTTAYYPKETLYLYFIALFFHFFGDSPVSLRLVSVFFGILTIPCVYVLLRYLFGSRAALGGMALFATAHWHLFFSRVGFRAILMLPILVLSVYYFFKATDTSKFRYYIAAGIFVGLGFYTYIPFRLVPVLFIIYFVHCSFRKRRFLQRNILGAALLAVLMITVMMPLLQFVFMHWDIFQGRVNQASVFNRFTGKDLRNELIGNIKIYLKMFHYMGDGHSRHNLPGHPALTFLIAITATPGFMMILMKFWTPRNLFYILWFIFMLIPGITTIIPPNSLRTISILPLAIICSGFFLYFLIEELQGTLGKISGIIVYPAILIILASNAYDTYNIYFVKSPQDLNIWEDFCYGEWAMAEYFKSFPEHRICYLSFNNFSATFTFLTRKMPKDVRMLDSVDMIPIKQNVDKNVLFMMEPPFEKEALPILHEFYPWGDFKTIHTPTGIPVLYTCALTREQVNNVFGINVTVFQRKETVELPVASFSCANFDDESFLDNLPPERPIKLVFEGSIAVQRDEILQFKVTTNQPFSFVLGGRKILEKIVTDPESITSDLHPVPKGFYKFRLNQIVNTGKPELQVFWSQTGRGFEPISSMSFYKMNVSSTRDLAGISDITTTRFIKVAAIPLEMPPDVVGAFRSMAVNRAGEIFLVNQTKNSVLKFSPDGKFVFSWGKEGLQNGEFKMPSGLALDSMDLLHVLDTANNRIQVFDSNGNYVRTYGKQLWYPNSFTITPQDDTFIADTGTHKIKWFNKEGNFIYQLGSKGTEDGQFLAPTAVQIDEAGNMYVLDSERKNIQVFSKNGSFLRKWNADILNRQTPMILTPGKKLLVPDIGRVFVKLYSLDGVWLAGNIFPDYELVNPRAITMNAQGLIYILENMTVVVFRESNPD